MPVRKQSGIEKIAGKLAFGAAALLAVAYSLGIMLAEKPAQKAIDEVNQVSAALRQRLQTKGQDTMPPVRGRDGILEPWLRVQKPREGLTPWLFERPPDLVAKIEKPVDPRKDLYPPAELAAKALPDFRIELSWKPDPRTTAAVKGYDVFRWKEGEQPPEAPLSDRLLAGPPFVDEDFAALEPLGKYSYAVRAHTDEDVKQGSKASRSAPVSVVLPDDRDVEYYGEGGVEMAVLYVKRFHKGTWVTGKFSVYLGDPVGGEAVVELSREEKVRIGCATPWILVEIGQEIRVRKETEKVQKMDDKGRPVFGPDGKPVVEDREVEKKVLEDFVVLADGEGAPKRVVKSAKPAVDDGGTEPKENDPLLQHKLHSLRTRMKEAKEPSLAGQLRKRIQFLERYRAKLVDDPARVDENLLNTKNGLLFENRWKWLVAADKALRFRNRPDFQREADDWMAYIKDLEEFLSPEGWDKEKGEWELDRADFVKKFGREAPEWNQMPERPDKPKDTKGK